MNHKVFKAEHIKRLVDAKENKEINVIECMLSAELEADPIGEGGNAEIFIPVEKAWETVCLKKIKERPLLHCNNIDEELRLQKKARRCGVRTPLCIISFEEKGEKFFIMERIFGNTIEEILKNPALLPEKFNYKIFCKSLDEQIKKLHTADGQMGGIYHRDLHLGNIMIDEGGLPVIIDFGAATEGTGSDFAYEESVAMLNSKTGRYDFVNGYFKDDLEMVKNIKTALKPFME